MFCPNCRRQLPDGTKFCSGCGTPIRAVNVPAPEAVQPPVAPPAPPAPPVQSAPAAPQAPVQHAPSAPKAPAEQVDVMGAVKDVSGRAADAAKKAATSGAAAAKKLASAGAAKAKALNIPPKYLKLGGIALAALIVIILVVSLIADGGSDANYVMYIKDGQVMYNDFGKEPLQVTKDLLENSSNQVLSYNTYDISSMLHITEDGKTVFYLDKIGSGDGTLFYRSLTNAGKDPEKIANGVSEYVVSANGKLVTYLKNDTLYQHDLKEDTKVSKAVSDFQASEDGKSLVYVTFEDGEYTYFFYDGKESQEICGGEEISIEYVSEDCKTVYFLDGDTLYKAVRGKDEEKVVSDITYIYGIQEDGSFYYAEEESASLADYFESDENYSWWTEELEASETTLYGTLYYFDGKKSSVVAENCGTLLRRGYGEDGYAIVYSLYNTDIDTFTMEELEEAYYNGDHGLSYTAELMVREAMSEDGTMFLVVDGKSSQIDLENPLDMDISMDGKLIYIACDEDADGTCVLYKASLSGAKVGKFEEVDDEVDANRGCYFLSDSNYFYYFKDVEDDTGELCVNGESVDDDVYVYGVSYNESRNAMLYRADYDPDANEGTLKLYDGKKVTEIDDDVYSFSHNQENGDIAYLKDYNSGKRRGDLLLYSGKKSVDVCDDVYSYRFGIDGSLLLLHDYSTDRYEGDLSMFDGKKLELIDEDVVALLRVYVNTHHSFG